MESPQTWSRLVASLACAELGDPDATWRFLVDEGLLQPTPEARRALDAALAAERDRVITGPSTASRIAHHVAPFATPAAHQPDPAAALSQPRFAAWRRR